MPPQRQRACSTTGCYDKQIQASAFGVFINDGQNCEHRLARPSKMKNPGLPIQLTEDSVGIRDGSMDFPIKLPGLQSSNLQAMPAIVGVLPDGTLVAWKFGNFAGKKKLSLVDGQLQFEEDYGSDLIAAAICTEPDCSLLDGALGFKTIEVTCPGEPVRTMTQICKIPKCCCADAPAEVCVSCEELDEFDTPEET